MAHLGDLNNDGHSDLGVGLPFIDSNHGAVWIYSGSSYGIETTPSQKINPSHLPGLANSHMFAYSISGNIDMDGNGYPDLLVSSFSEDYVVLIRSRPIIDMKIKIGDYENLQNIDLSDVSCALSNFVGIKCLKFRVCFQFRYGQRVNTSFALRYRLQSHSAFSYSHRSYFYDKFHKLTNVLKRVYHIDLLHMDRMFCQPEIIYFKNDIQDTQSPIELKVSYSLKLPRYRYRPVTASFPRELHPTLNPKNSQIEFQATFSKNCGDDNICQSDVQVHARFDTTKLRGDLTLIEVDENREVLVHVTVVNSMEPAHNTFLHIEFPEYLYFIGKEPKDNITCSLTNSKSLICNLGNPLNKEQRDLLLRFSMSGFSNRPETGAKRLRLRFQVNTTSVQISTSGKSNDFLLEAVLDRRSELEVNGISKPERILFENSRPSKVYKNIRYQEQIGEMVTHLYEVYNAGPSLAPYVDLIVQWPSMVKVGSDLFANLLYLIEVPIVQGDGECFIDKDYVNSMHLNLFHSPKETKYISNSGYGQIVYSALQDKYGKESKQNLHNGKIEHKRVEYEDKYFTEFTTQKPANIPDKYLINDHDFLNKKFTASSIEFSTKHRNSIFSPIKNEDEFLKTDEKMSKNSFSHVKSIDKSIMKTNSYYMKFAKSNTDTLHSLYGHRKTATEGSTQSPKQPLLPGHTRWADDTNFDLKFLNFDDHHKSHVAVDGTTKTAAAAGWYDHLDHHTRRTEVQHTRTRHRFFHVNHSVTDSSLHAYSSSANLSNSAVSDHSHTPGTSRDVAAGSLRDGGDNRDLTSTLGHGFWDVAGHGLFSHSDDYVHGTHSLPSRASDVHSRRKRSQSQGDRGGVQGETVSVPETHSVPDGLGRYTLVTRASCADNTAKCVQFKCRVNSLAANSFALVRVRSRLWNRTLALHYPAVSWMEISSRAWILLDPGVHGVQNVTSDIYSVTTDVYPTKPKFYAHSYIPLWIILLAVSLGFIVLACIILVCWRFGFFQRRQLQMKNKCSGS